MGLPARTGRANHLDPGRYFRDVTSGTNDGYSTSAGYDMATGLGSPISNPLVPNLVGSGK